MANKINIKMTSKEGVTLHTAGTYFDKDIQVIPDFPIEDGSGGSLVGERRFIDATYIATISEDTLPEDADNGTIVFVLGGE